MNVLRIKQCEGIIKVEIYCTGRRYNTITYQPFVPGINHCVEHGLIKQAIAHPFRNDDIYSIHRQLHLFHLSFYNGDNWKQQRKYKHFSHKGKKKTKHGTYVITHHRLACWLSQFSQHNLKCCCTQSIKRKSILV